MADDLSLDTRAEADKTPEKALRRWLLEIKLAQKREKDWRAQGVSIIETYRGTKAKKNSFNILWANTEVLRPAIYNSPPKPDVRRRFRQNDMLGKAVAEVMERGVSYCVDAYDLDNCLKGDVLDALLPGRGLSRIRYVPQLKKKEAVAQKAVEGADDEAAFQGDRDEVEYEQALCEHVQWDDFLHGPGKTWEEVEWVAFRARLTRDDLVEKFGAEVGKLITLNDVTDDAKDDQLGGDASDVFKRAELWEIWDKAGKKVFFVNESYKKGVIYAKPEDGEDLAEGEPPLKLKNFFPVPRPLQLVEDTGTLLPTPLYSLYEVQAKELADVSARIKKIVNACRVRFAYDPTLTELEGLTKAEDNDGLPVQNARAWMTNGGLDKAIWWMPIEQLAAVLRELYVARDAAKQVIYEITGISDIIRGTTNPNETLGAQKLKANSASLRLQRMQHEVQRYTRDLIRLLAEVIGEHFSESTLSQMTGMNFPTQQQKMMLQMQAQAASAQGQPVPKEMQSALMMPTWEEVMGVLRSDMQREYRVDVETDSTVAQSLQQDMEGMREVYTALVELWNGAGPAVASGALNVEVVKAMSLNIARRARMGLEVEDALETGMQAPKPQADPNAAKAEEAKVEAQAEAAKEAEITKREQADAQAEAQAKAAEGQQELARTAQENAHKENIRRMELDKEDAFERWKAELEADTQIIVAEISASASVETSQIGADAKADSAPAEGSPAPASKAKRKNPLAEIKASQGEHQGRMESLVQSIAQSHQSFAQLVGEQMQGMAASASAPVRIEKGPDGRAVAVHKGGKRLPVQRNPDGSVQIGTIQ